MLSVGGRHADRIRHAHPLSEEAQKKVETYYYDIRKQVFEYDEVMNNQRRAVYRAAAGAGWPGPEETGDWLRRAHHG